MVALLLTLEGGGTSLCSPSREYVSWLGVRRHTDTLPSCTKREISCTQAQLEEPPRHPKHVCHG